MSQSAMVQDVAARRPMGGWIGGWHVIAAFLAMAAAYAMLKYDAVSTLTELVSDKAYFEGRHPLLLDSHIRGYSVEQVSAHLAALGSDARHFYNDTYLAVYDLVFPLLAMAFSVLFILYATQPGTAHALGVAPRARVWLIAVPIALFVLDMGENISIRSMIDMQPAVNAKLVETASMFTQLKWAAAFVLGAILTGLGAFTVHRLIEGEKA